MRIIMVEGIDAVGKATIAKRIVEVMEAAGKNTRFFSFPRYETFEGQQIHAALDGNRHVTEYSRIMNLNILDRAKFFKDNLDTFKALDVEYLVMDRGYFTNVMYGGGCILGNVEAECRSTGFLNGAYIDGHTTPQLEFNIVENLLDKTLTREIFDNNLNIDFIEGIDIVYLTLDEDTRSLRIALRGIDDTAESDLSYTLNAHRFLDQLTAYMTECVVNEVNCDHRKYFSDNLHYINLKDGTIPISKTVDQIFESLKIDLRHEILGSDKDVIAAKVKEARKDISFAPDFCYTNMDFPSSVELRNKEITHDIIKELKSVSGITFTPQTEEDRKAALDGMIKRATELGEKSGIRFENLEVKNNRITADVLVNLTKQRRLEKQRRAEAVRKQREEDEALELKRRNVFGYTYKKREPSKPSEEELNERITNALDSITKTNERMARTAENSSLKRFKLTPCEEKPKDELEEKLLKLDEAVESTRNVTEIPTCTIVLDSIAPHHARGLAQLSVYRTGILPSVYSQSIKNSNTTEQINNLVDLIETKYPNCTVDIDLSKATDCSAEIIKMYYNIVTDGTFYKAIYKNAKLITVIMVRAVNSKPNTEDNRNVIIVDGIIPIDSEGTFNVKVYADGNDSPIFIRNVTVANTRAQFHYIESLVRYEYPNADVIFDFTGACKRTVMDIKHRFEIGSRRNYFKFIYNDTKLAKIVDNTPPLPSEDSSGYTAVCNLVFDNMIIDVHDGNHTMISTLGRRVEYARPEHTWNYLVHYMRENLPNGTLEINLSNVMAYQLVEHIQINSIVDNGVSPWGVIVNSEIPYTIKFKDGAPAKLNFGSGAEESYGCSEALDNIDINGKYHINIVRQNSAYMISPGIIIKDLENNCHDCIERFISFDSTHFELFSFSENLISDYLPNALIEMPCNRDELYDICEIIDDAHRYTNFPELCDDVVNLNPSANYTIEVYYEGGQVVGVQIAKFNCPPQLKYGRMG